MLKFQFYPIEVSYKIVEGKAIIYLYGRTTDGQQICVTDSNFEPYFYAHSKDDIKKQLEDLKVEKDDESFKVTKVELITKNLAEMPTQIYKVNVNLPSGIQALRDEAKKFSTTYEHDIKFVRRYLIDKGITTMSLVDVEGEQVHERSRVHVINASKITQISEDTIKDPKILAIDIETYNPLGKNVIPEEHPIVLLAIYDSDFKKVLTWKHFETTEPIEVLGSESEMIDRFKQIIAEQSPDIITGYFSDGFDLPYIKTRAQKYKIKLDLGLDHSELRLSSGEQTTAQITGISHLDIFKFVKKVLGRGLDTDVFTLDAVASELLGSQKVVVDLDNLARSWDHEPQNMHEFAKYNLHDARLTYDLCMKLLPNVIEMVKIIGLPLYDVSRMAFSQLVEWYLIKQAKTFNEIVLSRPSYDETKRREMKRLKGAFIFEPTPGLYQNISVFDYRSLYPSIIASHNISIGTLNCSCCPDAPRAPFDEATYRFCTKRKGFMSTVIEDLITRRNRIKEIIKKEGKSPLLAARSEGLKLLANSFYGYLSFAQARWYCFECGESVTAWGRHYIKTVIDKSQKAGFKVLYSDTDSIFLLLGKQTKEDALRFVDDVNRSLPGLMELDYESFYPAGIFVAVKGGEGGAKKKYAMIDSKGIMKIRGFETVRRNMSFIAKDMQRDVLDIILKELKPDKAIALVKGIIQDLRAGKVPVERVVIHTQLSKDISDYESIGPHVAAAQKMKAKGIDVSPGTIIKYVIAKGGGLIRERVKLPEEITAKDIDADYYIDNQILPAVEKIFAVFGTNKEDLVSSSTQGSLGKWF